jgi:hypothetical protein
MIMNDINTKALFSECEETDVFAEWKDMPEFVQGKQEPYAQMIIRFRNQQDLDEFSEMIGQKLTVKTKSLWHPLLVRGIHSSKVYKDE